MFAKPIVVANWKMNCTLLEAVRLMTGIRKFADTEKLISTCVICPPYTLLRDLMDMLPGTPLKLGAQNCFYEKFGAFTGEISAEMVHDMGAQFVILGHSERRSCFGESSELVRKKAVAVQQAKMTAVICVGETAAERDAGAARVAVQAQIDASVPDGSATSNLIIAYEPAWSIGTDRTPSAHEIDEMHGFIKEAVAAKMKTNVYGSAAVIYGGSVNTGNVSDILSLKYVDGVLLGRTSLNGDDFISVLRCAESLANTKILVDE